MYEDCALLARSLIERASRQLNKFADDVSSQARTPLLAVSVETRTGDPIFVSGRCVTLPSKEARKSKVVRGANDVCGAL